MNRLRLLSRLTEIILRNFDVSLFNVFLTAGSESMSGKPYQAACYERLQRKETECEGVDWIHLAQDWDQCRAVVNTGSMKSGQCLA